MSFSKARIQRFNEFENDVPPPGAYDPKFDIHTIGLAIGKTDRFNDNKSVGSAECNLTASSKSAANVIAGFRTPQLPRKKLTVKSAVLSTKAKPRALNLTRDPKLKYNSQHQLADLQVECVNKDETIKEHEMHIDEMKEEVRKLEAELEELRKKQAEVEEQHKKDIETMAQLQQDVLQNHNDNHQAEMEMLRCQLLQVSEEREHESKARKTMEGDLRSRIAEFSKRVASLESELAIKKENDHKAQVLEEQIEELTLTLKTVKENHNVEVSLLEKEKSQLNSYCNDLTEKCAENESKSEKRQNVILELQSQLSALQCELDELKAQYDKLIEDSAQQMFSLSRKHAEEIDKLKTCFEHETETLLNEKTLQMEAELKENRGVISFLTEELHDVQRLYKDLSHRLGEAHAELEESDKKHNLDLMEHKKELDDLRALYDEEKSKREQLEGARLDYLNEIENLTIARDREITELKEASAKKIAEETKRMKDHADKMVENAETVTRETLAACRTECEERVKRVIAESDAKVNAMIRDAKTAVEEEMRLTADRYKACLARMEVERTTLDEKLAHRDAEINRLSMTLEELKCSAETQESFGQSLQIELDRAETELAEKREELRALKDQIRAEAAEMVARRKRFEVIMAQNQASVTALTKRLAQSNAEVERLQHELKRGEDCIHEHRDLLSIMRNNSQMVHEQVHALMEQLDANKGLVDQLESDSVTELKSIKLVFEAKIDDLQKMAAKEITRLQEDCKKKTAQNTEIKSQLDKMADSLSLAQAMLLKLEERNDAQVLEISRIELVNCKVEEQSAQHKIALDEANSKIKELSDKVVILEEKENSSEDKTELFEEEKSKWKTLEKTMMEELKAERLRREAADEEVTKLSEYNTQLKKDYQEISEKYAELVGHQNHRQRIKHVSQLKDRITQLDQEVRFKTRVIEQQQKTIEKLKNEEKRAHSKGKENILGIPKSAHSTPISSPHKPPTPLRSRND